MMDDKPKPIEWSIDPKLLAESLAELIEEYVQECQKASEDDLYNKPDGIDSELRTLTRFAKWLKQRGR